VLVSRFVLKSANQVRPQALISPRRQQGNIETANFIRRVIDLKSPNALLRKQNQFIDGVRIISLFEGAVRFILLFQKVIDFIFGPTEPTQILATAAFVKLKQKILIVRSRGSQGDRIDIYFSHLI
jgi:hypothetical protein